MINAENLISSPCLMEWLQSIRLSPGIPPLHLEALLQRLLYKKKDSTKVVNNYYKTYELSVFFCGVDFKPAKLN